MKNNKPNQIKQTSIEKRMTALEDELVNMARRCWYELGSDYWVKLHMRILDLRKP